MGMEIELVLLGVLILVFIASFCGLLQKLRKTYEQEGAHSERTTRAPPRSEIHINPNFITEPSDGQFNGSGVFPGAPPPYSETYCEPPPKYEDIIKSESCHITIPDNATRT